MLSIFVGYPSSIEGIQVTELHVIATKPLLNVSNSRHSNHAVERNNAKRLRKKNVLKYVKRTKKHDIVASGQLSRAYRILLVTVHLQKKM